MNSANALNSDDCKIILLGLDLLSKHADIEIAHARKHGNNAKQLAMQTMRQQIMSARTKIVNRRGQPL